MRRLSHGKVRLQFFFDRISCLVLEITGIVSQLAPPSDYLYIYDGQDGTSVLVKASLLTPDQGCLCNFPKFPTYETTRRVNLLLIPLED